MKNKFLLVLMVSLFGMVSVAHADYDAEDPMYLTGASDFLSSSSLSIYDGDLRLAQKFSYGINGILSLDADIKYQQDFNSEEDGFSNVGLGVTYRTSRDSSVISDALFGINFRRNSEVAEFSNTIYSAGYRIGHRWSRFTLAGAIKTSWIFAENDGVAYIDLMPDAYLHINDMWAVGMGFDFRKATDSELDRRWINGKLTQTYGRTQYVETIGYEFRTQEYLIGGRVNIIF